MNRKSRLRCLVLLVASALAVLAVSSATAQAPARGTGRVMAVTPTVPAPTPLANAPEHTSGGCSSSYDGASPCARPNDAVASTQALTPTVPYERQTVPYWDPSETAPLSEGEITLASWAGGAAIPTGARYRAASATCDGRTYYVIGGQTRVDDTWPLLDETWRYDPTSDSWTPLAPLPVALMNMEAECINDVLYLVGGYDSDAGAHTNNFQIYDIATDTWTATTWPEERTPMAAAWRGRLYVFGGNPGPSDETRMYDCVTETWTDPLAPMPTGEAYGAALTVGDYIYHIGGGSSSLVQRYDPLTNTWDASGPQLQDERMSALTVWYGDRIYVVGGGGVGGDVWVPWATTEVYDPAQWPGGAWSYDDETVPVPGVAMAGACAACRIWGAGGDNDGTLTDANQSLYDGGYCHEDRTAPTGSVQINGGAPETWSQNVTLNPSATDAESSILDMRFTNELRVLLVQDQDPWYNPTLESALAANGVPYDLVTSAAMPTVDLGAYPVVIIPGNQPQAFYDAYQANRSRFEAYVAGGGLLEFHAAAYYSGPVIDLSYISLPGGVQVDLNPQDYNHIAAPYHPLVAGLTSPIPGNDASHGSFTDILPGTLVLCTEGTEPGGGPTLIEYPYGSGLVIATGQPLEYGWAHGWSLGGILTNAVRYASGHGAEPQPWSASVGWQLSPGLGLKTVHAQFRNRVGMWSPVYADSITFDRVYVFLPVALRNLFINPYEDCGDAWTEACLIACGARLSAFPDDTSDYYAFELSIGRTVTVRVEDYRATGQLILYRDIPGDEPELITSYGGGGTTMTISRALGAGRYYARVYTTSGQNTTWPYRLTLTCQ